MMFIVITMFFSGGLIPSYLLIKSLGLIDSRWALIIPGLISTYLAADSPQFLHDHSGGA